jgi:DNA primase large subunit
LVDKKQCKIKEPTQTEQNNEIIEKEIKKYENETDVKDDDPYEINQLLETLQNIQKELKKQNEKNRKLVNW